MKTFVYALVALALLLGLVVSPASAAPAAAACGDTYVVQKGDYLTKIAKTCGVTYDSLVKANPEIKNPSLIYVGQVIRIKAGASVPTPTPAPSSGTTYTVVKGDTLYKIAVRFGTTTQAILAANPEIKNASLIYVGQVIKLPVGSTSGGGATSGLVTISATSAKVGAVIDVTVKGFPANAEVDFRLGKQGEAYSVVVDGKTDASGNVTGKVTIPTIAKAGEKWVVVAMTTSLAAGKSATSPVITIAQ